MLKSPPLNGQFPLIQSFGDNPELYQTVACHGVKLRGHNGMDYATPIGTPVFAVQDGTVLEIGYEEDGFGHYVMLGHSWGQTLYAHLDRISVVQGQPVGGGSQVGLAGDSGSSAGPHLHFGMRIHPFSVADGWCGFSDPQPYLARLTEPRGANIGPHLVGGVHKHLDLLRQWQPRMILVLDPNPNEMRELREVCPDAVIVGRPFVPDHEMEGRIRDDPHAAAQWAHNLVMARMTPDVDYWQVANEILQKEDSLPLLNEFELARMALAEADGYRCALFAFSVGNPDLPGQSEATRMDHWELVYPALARAEQKGHIVAVHQYGMPDLWGPDDLADWLIYRLEHQVLRRLPYKKVQFAVTEYGIDGLIQGPGAAGWQRFTDADGYAQQLLKSGRYTERFSGRVLGYAVFTLGHNAPWGSYDIAGDVAWTLANESQKGTWAQVDISAGTLGSSDGDTVTAPGGTGGGGITPLPPVEPEKPTEPEQPTIPDQPIEPEQPTQPEQPVQPSTPDEGGETVETSDFQRFSEWVDKFNIRRNAIEARPDAPGGDDVYVVKDIFTTRDGSWEPSNVPGGVPQWARDAYLRPEFLEAGANHHLFAAVLDSDGNFIKNQPVRYWSDGYDRLGDSSYTGYVTERTKESSGWANMFMAGGSSFVPERGESGPWCWGPEGASEIICGGGLPANQQVSTFVVWQKMTRAEYDALMGAAGGGQPDQPTEPEKPTQPEQPTEPETPTQPEQPTEPEKPTEPETPTVPVAPNLEQRISEWATHFNVKVNSFANRPDNPAPDDEYVYVLKDLFTTILGSWEPSHQYGSVPEWAREAYLKPFGAPDYFDDAGGDHHLFAAVIGPDGELVPNREILFWSDGYDMLEDATYNGYVKRTTKDKSGWINIPIGPGSSFVPERGERGPWCWAPTGAADVVCGGGLPAKNHISTFAVWQAVKRSDLDADGTVTVPEKPTQPEGPTQPDMPSLPPVADVVRRVSPWVAQMNMTVRQLENLPVAPEGDTVLVVKDIFTTRDGSWEPDDGPYAVPQWARDAYLKPYGASDYFADAGAEHNLFAAVIGLDGQLIKQQEVIYWSGGFDKLDDPNFTGFVAQQTDDISGWTDIPIGPNSSFVPANEESGPWCWVPKGGTEVVCGGGLPDNLRVSTFVVWQVVTRAQLEQGGAGSSSGHSIFLPIISQGGKPESHTDADDAAIDEGPRAQADAAMDAAAMDAAALGADDAGPPAEELSAALDASVMTGAAWLRQAAWQRIGIEPDLRSPLAEHARTNRLGMPVTQVFSVGSVDVQGYMGGIVYMQRGKPDSVAMIPW